MASPGVDNPHAHVHVDEDGRLYGFEGCHGASTHHDALDGCCPMNCTHVWNYEMALAKLFPDLEQSMRRTDLIDQISPWGSIPHRTTLPLYLPRPWTDFIGGPRNPAMDGELGTVLKAYREVRHGADQEWFDEMWPSLKKVMANVMTNYDSEGDGVIRGEQPNTYDISIYGAQHLYRHSLPGGVASIGGNGKAAGRRGDWRHSTARVSSWDAPTTTSSVGPANTMPRSSTWMNIPNSSLAPAATSTNFSGQWWAFQLDLGYVLPEEHVRTTIRNIYTFNRRETFRIEDQRPRVYLDARDRGTYICTWPHGGKPEVPTQYSDEVWTGLEYPLAAMLMREGEIDASLTMLSDIRDRHDGSRRSPWNEVECGDHYVRAMASWSLLEEAAGYVYDSTQARLTLAPRIMEGDFRSFFITGSAWGVFRQEATDIEISIDYGGLTLSELVFHASGESVQVRLNDQPIEAEVEVENGFVHVRFPRQVMFVAGDTVQIRS